MRKYISSMKKPTYNLDLSCDKYAGLSAHRSIRHVQKQNGIPKKIQTDVCYSVYFTLV